MKSRGRRALDFIRIILSFSSSPDFNTKNVRICDKYVSIWCHGGDHSKWSNFFCVIKVVTLGTFFKPCSIIFPWKASRSTFLRGCFEPGKLLELPGNTVEGAQENIGRTYDVVPRKLCPGHGFITAKRCQKLGFKKYALDLIGLEWEFDWSCWLRIQSRSTSRCWIATCSILALLSGDSAQSAWELQVLSGLLLPTRHYPGRSPIGQDGNDRPKVGLKARQQSKSYARITNGVIVLLYCRLHDSWFWIIFAIKTWCKNIIWIRCTILSWFFSGVGSYAMFMQSLHE